MSLGAEQKVVFSKKTQLTSSVKGVKSEKLDFLVSPLIEGKNERRQRVSVRKLRSVASEFTHWKWKRYTTHLSGFRRKRS